MEKQQHINPEYFKTGLSPEEYSHLAACPFCCEQFADYIENQELITAPAHLKSSIMERSRDLDVQIVAARQSKFRSELQWDYYETVNYLTEQLGRLSNINMEVFKNDKKER